MADTKVLHLGVTVVPYRSRNGKVTGLTTADVAGFLERRYQLMATFFIRKEQKIVNAIQDSQRGAMEAILMGAPASDSYASACQKIDSMFKTAINRRETETWSIPNVPTKAALMGHSQRRAHPYAKGPRRPSFRDTGLYSSSFKSWVS